MSSNITRRTFIGAAAGAGVTLLRPGRWAAAQDARGSSMTAPVYNITQRATMILGSECKVVNDPNREERLALASLRERA